MSPINVVLYPERSDRLLSPNGDPYRPLFSGMLHNRGREHHNNRSEDEGGQQSPHESSDTTPENDA